MDGFGTELGGTAMLLVIVSKVIDLLKERRSRRTAVAVADRSEKANSKNSPEEITLSRKRMNGKSSIDFMLHTLNQHTEEIGVIRRDISRLRESVGRIEGRLGLEPR